MDSELEQFKTDIDLRGYAAEQGYQLDRKESWRGSAVMRHANGDKIIIKRGADGHYIYFSVHQSDDNGTIIDFVQKRMRISLGAVRKELRPYLGAPSSQLPAFSPLQKTSKDQILVETEYAETRDALHGLPYLENERGLPASLLASKRFAGRVRIDKRGNAIFPHIDAEGIVTGFEKKNKGFTGFASGGTKGLWLSNLFPDDTSIILCESGIEGLSYALLFPDARARYGSIGGKLNPSQPEQILREIVRMPANSEIVAAMNADKDGRDLARVVRQAFESSGRSDLRFKITSHRAKKIGTTCCARAEASCSLRPVGNRPLCKGPWLKSRYRVKTYQGDL